MRSSSEKKGGRAGRKRAKPAAPKRPRANTAPAAGCDEASQRFVKDLLVRGEAAKLTKEGKLPLGATHVVVKENADGTAKVQRARYRAF